MRSFAIAFTIAALIAGHSLAAAQSMTPQQYHKEKDPCAWPDDKDKAGKRCGKRSAFCRSGGAEIKGCFLTPRPGAPWFAQQQRAAMPLLRPDYQGSACVSSIALARELRLIEPRAAWDG